MQSFKDLEDEIETLRTFPGTANLALMESTESWNPVAAVELIEFALPAGIEPGVIDIRIPIPDLYAFAASTAVAVIDHPLTCNRDDVPVLVPFCTPVTQVTLDLQRHFYVDARENGDQLLGRHTVCVTPSELPRRFVHMGLPDFVQALTQYLADPIRAVQVEIENATRELERSEGGSQGVLRLAHLLEGLGDYETSAQVLDRGLELYPRNPWLHRKRGQIQGRRE